MNGSSVKALRLSLALSQERFAHLLGVSLQTVRRWENGMSRPLPIISLKLEELARTVRRKGKVGGVFMGGRARDEESRRGELGLGGLLKGLGSFFELAAKVSEEGGEEVTRTGRVEGLGGGLTGVYGFTVRAGLGGEPVIERFGNIRETEEGSVVTETREPVVDVLDEGEDILVIAELPGVDEEEISLEVRGNVLEIAGAGRGRRYRKEVLLPAVVAPESVSSSYKNGILEVRCRKA